MLTCQCPNTNPIQTISPVTCAERFGQTQKVIFQRLRDSSIEEGDNRNGIVEPNANDVDYWVALKSANNDTKIAVTPYIENPTPDGGDAKTVGGGNETLNGAETVIGSNPVGMTFDMNNMPQSVVDEMENLMCEVLGHNLGVYLVNEKGQLRGIKESVETGGTTTVTWRPIPIQTLFVGEWQPGGLDANDKNILSFKFVPGYLKKTAILTPTDGNFLSL